jgi:hypothetical protein
MNLIFTLPIGLLFGLGLVCCCTGYFAARAELRLRTVLLRMVICHLAVLVVFACLCLLREWFHPRQPFPVSNLWDLVCPPEWVVSKSMFAYVTPLDDALVAGVYGSMLFGVPACAISIALTIRRRRGLRGGSTQT